MPITFREVDEKRQKESLRNPTDAMKEIMRRMEVREKERQQMSWQQQLQILTQVSVIFCLRIECDLILNNY